MVLGITILIFAIIIGINWWLGSWNVLINLINFYISALVASSYFEIAADQIETANRTLTYLADFIALWAIFFLTFIVIRAITDLLSKFKMNLPMWLEYTLRSVFALWLAIGFLCFAMFSLHLAPIPPTAFQVDVQDSTMGFGPDRMWMAFVQSRSRGALAESKNAMFVGEYDLQDHPDDADLGARVFDPYAQFIPNYHTRRATLSTIEALRVNK